MARATCDRTPATIRRGRLVAVVLVVLAGSAPASIETLSGKIMSVDRGTGCVTVRPMGSAADRILHLSRQTVVAGAPGYDDIAGLAIGQVITASLETETRSVRKLSVVLAPVRSSVARPHPGDDRTTRSALKPKPPEPSPNTVSGATMELARAEANRVYGLRVTRARSVDAVLTYVLTYPNATAREWVVLAPRIPELPGQTNVRSGLAPDGSPAWDLSPSHRPLLLSRLAVTSRDRSRAVSARAEYQATLMARHLYRRSTAGEVADATPLGTEERRRALARGGAFELDAPEFRRWLSAERLAMGGNESEIDYARRVFLGIKRGMTYEYREGMDRRLSHVCASARSDCGGLAILFVAALRSQAIPARVLVGRWATSAEPGAQLGGSPYYQWHVKAEFYAAGVGWIPADPAAGLVYDRSAEGLRYFGHDEGDFLTLHVDPDLVLDSIHFGPQPTPFLNGGLGVWVLGSGSLANPRLRQDWQVRAVEGSSRAGQVAESLRSPPSLR